MGFLAAALPAIGAIGQIGSGVAGAIAGSSARGDANSQMQAAFDQLNQLGIPPDTAAPIILQQLQSAGQLTPQLEQAINYQATQIKPTNPALQQAQMQALQGLQQVSNQGLRPEDRAAFNQLRQQAATEAEAKRQQIIQNYQSRGLGGGGAELAAQLSGAQAGDQQLAAGGDQIAAAASQRALQALGQVGSQAGQMESQQFGENQANAAITNAMNQFNVQNQLAQQQRNVGAQNQAQQYNLSNAQGISNQNVTNANAELQRQKQAQLADYQNKANLAQAKSNALLGQATQSRADAQQAGQAAANIGSGIGSAAGGIYANQQKSDFLNSLTDDQKKDLLTKYYSNPTSTTPKV